MLVTLDYDLCKQIDKCCCEYDHCVLKDVHESSDRVHQLRCDLGDVIGSNDCRDILFVDIGDLVSLEVSGEFVIFLIKCPVEAFIVHEYGDTAFIINDPVNCEFILLVF